MRAFSTSQTDVFLNAFGQSIETSTGITFTGIVEVIPFTIESGVGGLIEGEERYVSTNKITVQDNNLTLNTILIINQERYIVYNIIDDLSGMINLYFRTEEGQSFAEDY